jgi:O-antigen ligase
VTGLKPAASVLAMLTPLAAAAPMPVWARAAVMIAGTAVILVLPGDSAKVAALAGVAVAAAAVLAPRLAPRLLGAVLAAGLLLAPTLLEPGIPRGPSAEALPPSAVHRLMIWDFTLTRIAERPLLGWGMEASRAIPGGGSRPEASDLDRLGLRDPWLRGYFGGPLVQRLPLHPHNGALQIRLELGLPGALLAAALALALGLAAARAPSPPAAAGAMAAAAVTGLLSFGTWQAWWVAAQLLALVAAAAVPAAMRSAAPSRAGVGLPAGRPAQPAPPPAA